MHYGYAPRHAEPGWAGVARVEVEHAADRLGKRLVGMPEDDDVRLFTSNTSFQRVFQGVGIHDMMNQEFPVGQFYDRGQFVPQSRIVRIAADSGDRGDLLEFE